MPSGRGRPDRPVDGAGLAASPAGPAKPPPQRRRLACALGDRVLGARRPDLGRAPLDPVPGRRPELRRNRPRRCPGARLDLIATTAGLRPQRPQAGSLGAGGDRRLHLDRAPGVDAVLWSALPPGDRPVQRVHGRCSGPRASVRSLHGSHDRAAALWLARPARPGTDARRLHGSSVRMRDAPSRAIG